MLVNCISPVAVTRIYSRPDDTGELTPQQVAPGCVYLASSACAVTGLVLRASDGHFSIGAFHDGPGLEFGSAVTTPEAIASGWSQLAPPADG